MLGIIIGTAAALGTCAYLRRRRYARHYDHCAHSGHHRHHRHHRGWSRDDHWRGPDFGSRGPRRWVAMLADRLDASREQERVMYDAVRELLDELRGMKREVIGTRSDIGEAFGSDRLDEQRLGDLFARHDEVLVGARKAVVGALSKIHDVLEPKQREQLSQWLGRQGFNPYRM